MVFLQHNLPHIEILPPFKKSRNVLPRSTWTRSNSSFKRMTMRHHLSSWGSRTRGKFLALLFLRNGGSKKRQFSLLPSMKCSISSNAILSPPFSSPSPFQADAVSLKKSLLELGGQARDTVCFYGRVEKFLLKNSFHTMILQRLKVIRRGRGGLTCTYIFIFKVSK